MRRIKVKFADYYGGHVPVKDPYYGILSRRYEVELSDEPDYLFDGGLGLEHLRYDRAVKIVTLGENLVPDFNCFDYAVGFDRLTFGDRYLRVPLYVFFDEYRQLGDRRAPSPESLLRRDFCSYVVSNAGMADPLRTRFFHELSKYRRVDSGGRHLNNVGGPVADKAAFCRRYKFAIAFENCANPGYVTEKVMQPLAWFSLPIYYGDPFVEEEFSADSLVRVRDADDVERAIEEIVRLDRNDDEYLARVTAPCLARPHGFYGRALEEFLYGIIDRPLDRAKRLAPYGYQPYFRSRLEKFRKIESFARGVMRPIRRLMKP